MRQIESAEELHGILLGIGRAFDDLCRKHNIPYYMLGGTMLGAVRHGGIIPWDDDLDFGVPREFFDRLKQVLSDELPDPYRVVTLEKSDSMLNDIIKIEDSRTEMDEIYKENSKDHIGVNIDIFPLDHIRDLSEVKRVFPLLRFNNYRVLSLKQREGIKLLAAIAVKVAFFWLGRQTIPKYISKKFSSNTDGKYYANLFGAWGIKEVVDKQFFLPGRVYDFNGLQLEGVGNPDAYLSQLYGDYMKLPSEGKRHFHITGCRWKS